HDGRPTILLDDDVEPTRETELADVVGERPDPDVTAVGQAGVGDARQAADGEHLEDEGTRSWHHQLVDSMPDGDRRGVTTRTTQTSDRNLSTQRYTAFSRPSRESRRTRTLRSAYSRINTSPSAVTATPVGP